jgi:hypothetical protein
MVRILGLMGVSIQAHGKIIICMAMVSTHGRMVDDMKAIMKWIRSTAMECILGLMEEDMKVIGLMESSMDKESIYYQMEQLK